MFLIAKTLPLALATAVALLFASAAQAHSLDLGVSHVGLLSSLSPSHTTFDGVGSADSEKSALFSLVDEKVGAGILAYSGSGDVSSLPSPATWAMMLAGFGLTGAMLRRGQLYRLIEHYADGAIQTEDFHAPDDQSALERALSVAEGVRLELWRGDELVHRIDAPVHAAG